MKPQITDELIAEIARLARLAPSAEELAALRTHFEKVLAFVESLESLETSGVDPSHFAREAFNRQRDDDVRESLPIGDVLRNAPAARSPFFAVPRILGEPGAGGA